VTIDVESLFLYDVRVIGIRWYQLCPEEEAMDATELTEFATRYAAAWRSAGKQLIE
jgi:hypothetical protein